jgi:hypothetical protein
VPFGALACPACSTLRGDLWSLGAPLPSGLRIAADTTATGGPGARFLLEEARDIDARRGTIIAGCLAAYVALSMVMFGPHADHVVLLAVIAAFVLVWRRVHAQRPTWIAVEDGYLRSRYRVADPPRRGILEHFSRGEPSPVVLVTGPSVALGDVVRVRAVAMPPDAGSKGRSRGFGVMVDLRGGGGQSLWGSMQRPERAVCAERLLGQAISALRG